MKQIDIEKINWLYRENGVNFVESSYIEIDLKLDKWQKMNDSEKLACRIDSLKLSEKLETEEKFIKADRLGIELIQRIFILLEMTEPIEFNSIEDDLGILFRIKILFFCIKNSLLVLPSVKTSILYVEVTYLNKLAKQISDSLLIKYEIESLIKLYKNLSIEIALIKQVSEKN